MREYLKLRARLMVSKLRERNGGDYVNTGIIILIAVVVGALLLGGLYYMFGDVVLPILEQRIRDMFDYKGGGYTP